MSSKPIPAPVRTSEAEYDALDECEEGKLELDEGELVMTASPNLFHNRVRDHLGRSLANYAALHHLGEVTWETDFHLGQDIVRIPDLGFWRTAHAPAAGSRQRPQQAPDLAVEVISPSNRARDMVRKVEQYLRAGAHTVWLIYPEEKFVHIYRGPKQIEIRDATQSLDAPELLPGWSLPLAELFAAALRYFAP